MSLPNTSFLPVVPLSIPFKKSPSSFLNCCSLTCLFLGVRTRHVHTYLQTAEAAPPLTSIPITMLAAASLHHYTRQDHHAHCCISSSLHKARSPCSLLHLFITTQGKITMLVAASLHHYTRKKQGGTSHHNRKEKLQQPTTTCNAPGILLL